MSSQVRDVPADLSGVWKVLCDAASYGDWVVGTWHTHPLDVGFPTPEARLGYRLLPGPLPVHGHSTVRRLDQPRVLVLEAFAPHLGSMLITITTEQLPDGGTRVMLEEHPHTGLLVRAESRLFERLISLRNRETLRRLARLAVDASATAAQE